MEDFYGAAAKKSIAAVVEDVRVRASLPIVVALQHRAGDYPEASLRGGLLLSALYLALFLYFPEPFDTKYLFAELAGAFVVGALAAWSSEFVWRKTTSETRRHRAVEDAARARFAAARETCLLVFVATAEARVEVVTDAATRAALGEPLTEAAKKLDRAVRLDADRERFEKALRELGDLVCEVFPDADVASEPPAASEGAAEPSPSEEAAAESLGAEPSEVKA